MGVRQEMIDSTLARSIRLVVLDVDGVLTDGGVYIGAVNGQPMEFKRYDIQDGLGIYFMKMAGLRVGIITGRVSESVRLRAAELGIEDLAQDPDAQKLPALLSMIDRHGIALSEVAFVGDDFPDLAVLRIVGLPVAVGNAVAEAKAACTLQLKRSGGAGAVREFSELLLKARGEWNEVTERYVQERSLSRTGPGAGRAS
jgi:3-deoxy-D-manno-octulosonate 8-phosphate phosphatase (KDO 8-P phosphatase)